MGFFITRPVLNPEILAPWHSLTGVSHHSPHVTLIYSKADVDYTKSTFSPDTGSLCLPINAFVPKTFFDDNNTDKPVLVASFDHPILSARHRALRRAGAAWDFPDYIPHITLGKTAITPPLLLTNTPLELGPESITRF